MPLKPFFSLLDGALNYDCSSCKAACCRGGYGTAVMHGREWANLKQKYPLISYFAIDQGKYIYLINHAPKCFFLNNQYLCQIEWENSRIEKPLQCRIFPYQICGRVQDRPFIRVGLLCPFTVHEGLDGNIRSENFYREIEGPRVVEKAYDIFDTQLESFLPAPLSLETSSIESARTYFRQGDIEGFLTEQLAASSAVLRETGLISGRPELSSRLIMEKLISQQCQFLGIDPARLTVDKKIIGRSLISISPVLRSSMLEKHPYFQVGYLLALYLYSLISNQIQDDSLTVQTIASISLQLGTKLEYLALFPFLMTPRCSPETIISKTRSLLDKHPGSREGHYPGATLPDYPDSADPEAGDRGRALLGFVEDILQGTAFGSAACRHFGPLCEFSKNQAIEYYIHYLLPFFVQAFDEEAFLTGKKATSLCRNQFAIPSCP